MIDREKVKKALERCLICDISVVAPEEAQKAYRECEYTVGLYCGQKKVLQDTVGLLKEQEETINDLTDTIRQLNQHIKDLSEYMTPYGVVKDVKAYNELVKEKEDLGKELINAVELIRKKNKRIEKLLIEQEAVEPRVSSVEQRCGNCNKVIEMDGWKSCPWCGKPIAWSEWWNKNTDRR